MIKPMRRAGGISGQATRSENGRKARASAGSGAQTPMAGTSPAMANFRRSAAYRAVTGPGSAAGGASALPVSSDTIAW
jgi:hypothetical protein